jgi:hypothetical protein
MEASTTLTAIMPNPALPVELPDEVVDHLYVVLGVVRCQTAKTARLVYVLPGRVGRRKVVLSACAAILDEAKVYEPTSYSAVIDAALLERQGRRTKRNYCMPPRHHRRAPRVEDGTPLESGVLTLQKACPERGVTTTCDFTHSR